MLRTNDLKQQNIALKIVESSETGDKEGVVQALNDFHQSIADSVKADFMEYQKTSDKTILVQRGYRQLTKEEEQYYQKFIDASKSKNPMQAFVELEAMPEGMMPETIIEDVFKDLIEEHPLLNKINFNYTKYLTKWVLNDHTKSTAVWGEITSEITQEISSAFKVVDIIQNKLSAFAAISLDMLDLGPVFLDKYIRTILKEALICGLEKAIIKGTGNNEPIGLNRNVSKGVSVSGGVYPEKDAIKVTSFEPTEYAKLLSKLSTSESGRIRKISDVLMICNQVDYFNKIMPATTPKNLNGEYTKDVFCYPTEVVISNEVDSGKAILCLPKEYFMAVCGDKNGIITYSDEYKFIEDMRYYKIKTYGTGKAFDNNASLLLDISELSPTYITVQNVAQPAAASTRKSK